MCLQSHFWGRGDRRIPGVFWPASLAESEPQGQQEINKGAERRAMCWTLIPGLMCTSTRKQAHELNNSRRFHDFLSSEELGVVTSPVSVSHEACPYLDKLPHCI